MTIQNRTVTIKGVFGQSASTTIPDPPASGASYRDESVTQQDIEKGWAYKEIVDSAQFNEALYEYSYITKQIEKYGFLPWSSLTDYEKGSICLGSDEKTYQAVQATGPSSAAYDPVNDTNHTYWKEFLGQFLTVGTDQNVTSKKTFTGQQQPIKIECPWTLGTPPDSTTYRQIQYTDENGTVTGGLEKVYYQDGAIRTQIACRNPDGTNDYEVFGIGYGSNGVGYASATAGVKASIRDWNAIAVSGKIQLSSGSSTSGSYTTPSDGFIWARASGNNRTAKVNVGGVEVFNSDWSSNYSSVDNCYIRVPAGSTVTWTNTQNDFKLWFFPCRGVS